MTMSKLPALSDTSWVTLWRRSFSGRNWNLAVMSVFFLKSFSRALHIFHLRVVDRRDGHLAPRRTTTPAPREPGSGY